MTRLGHAVLWVSIQDADPLDVVHHLLLRQFGHLSLLGERHAHHVHPKRAVRARRSSWASSPYDPDFCFSTCTSTDIKSRGAAASTDTNCCIGACSRKSNFAYNSGLPGKLARSVTAPA